MQVNNVIYTPKFYGNQLRNINRVLPKVTPKELGGLVLAPAGAIASTVLAANDITKSKPRTPENNPKLIEEIRKDLNDCTNLLNNDGYRSIKNAIISLNDSPEKDELIKTYNIWAKLFECILCFEKSKGENINYPIASCAQKRESLNLLFRFFKENPESINEFEETVKLPIKNFNGIDISDLKHKGSGEKIKFFLGNKELRLLLESELSSTMYTPKDIIANPKITPNICRKSIKEVHKSLDKNLAANPETIADLFVFACFKNAKLLTQRDFNIHLETLKYVYANTDKLSAQLISSAINQNSINLSVKKPHNLDAAIYYTENSSDFDREYLYSILKTDYDISKNEEAFEHISNNLDELNKKIKERTRHSTKKFKEWAEQYLANPINIKNFYFIPNLNEDMIINGFYGVSKLISCINKKPEDYISGRYKSANKDEILQSFGNQINLNFNKKLNDIYRAILSTDLETVKLFMDKRLNKFSAKIDYINEISPQYRGILSDFIRNGRQINKLGEPVKLSGWQKEALVDIIANYSTISKTSDIEINLEKYKTKIDDKHFILDIDYMQKDLLIYILKQLGFSDKKISGLKPENMNWDKKYISHFVSSEIVENKELQTLIKIASEGNFANFIKDPKNKYGRANMKTEKIFNSQNLSYDVWLNGIGERKFMVSGEEYTINLWKRIPQESIFDGEYTTCCTAINEQEGKFMPIYIMNTAFNVVEVKDSDGNTVGMARCFMAKTRKGKNILIVEGLETNKKLVSKIRNNNYWYNSMGNEYVSGIKNYMNEFAQKIGGEGTQVFVSSKNLKVNDKQFNYYNRNFVPISLLGKVAADKVYFNVLSEEINPNQLKNKTVDLYLLD